MKTHKEFEKSQRMERLNDAQIIIYSSLTQEGKIEDYLKQQPTGTAHPFTKGGRQYLLIKLKNGIIDMVDITDIDPKVFLSNTDVSKLEGVIGNFLPNHKLLIPFKDFDIPMISVGSTKQYPRDMSVFCRTDQSQNHSKYLDLVLYYKDTNGNTRVCTYHTKSNMHSGDTDRPNLLHNITNLSSLPIGTKVYFALVGYNKSQLKTYTSQNPSVCIVNPLTKEVCVIPINIAEVAVGNSTMTLPFAGSIGRDGEITLHFFNTPPTVPGVNTGDINPSITNALQQCDDIIKQMTNDSAHNSADKTVRDVPTLPSPSPSPLLVNDDLKKPSTSFSGNGCLVFSTHELPNVLQFMKKYGPIIYTGLGFSLEPQPPIPELPYLPSVSGTVTGTGAALGKTNPDIDTNNCSDTLNIVLVNSCSVPDTVAKYPRTHYNNGIFIITVHKSLVISNALLNFSKNPSILYNIVNELPIRNDACEAGPPAIILVCIVDRLFWYSGVRLPGLKGLEVTVPKYCEEVTHIFTEANLTNYIANINKNIPWSMRTRIDPTQIKICFRNKMYTFTSIEEASIYVLKQFQTLNLEDLSKISNDIIDLFKQICVLFNQSEAQKLKDELYIILNAKIDTYLQPFKDKAKQNALDLYNNVVGVTKERCEESLKDLKTKKNQVNKSMLPIINAIANITSQHGISTKNQSIAREQRKSKIASNVADANAMSIIELFESFIDKTEKNGFLICQFNTKDLEDLIASANTAVYKQLCNSCPRFTTLDGDTTAALAECTVDITTHEMFLKGGIALPLSPSERLSILPIPIWDKYSAEKVLSTFNWGDDSKNSETSAWHIKLRHTIANTIGRKVNVSSKSPILGFCIIQIIMNMIESLCSKISNIPNPETDWDNTTSEILRSLFGILFYMMASGTNGHCPGFQFTYKDPKIEKIDPVYWYVLIHITKYIPYTCWSTENWNRNMRRFIIKTISSYIVNDSLHHMQKKLSSVKNQKCNIVKNPELISFIRLIIEVIYHLIINNKDITPEIARKLLKHKPDESCILNNGTKSICTYLEHLNSKNLSSSLNTLNFNEDKDMRERLKFIVGLEIKYSGNIPVKNDLRKSLSKALTGDDIVDLLKSIHKPNWTSSNDPLHDTNFSNIVKIEPSSEPCITQVKSEVATISLKADDEALSIVKTAPTLVEMLETNPGSKDAVTLANNISIMTCDTALPNHTLKLLIESLGITEPDIILRGIIKNLLLNWNDADRETLSLQVFEPDYTYSN